MNNNLLKTKHIIKSVHLSLVSTNKMSQKTFVLNIRVSGNTRSLSLFSRSDVALTLFTTGLFRSNWPTDPQTLIYISHS